VLREFIHLFAPLTANCRDFNARWAATTVDAGSVGGRWRGKWVSETSKHRGPLRCVLSVISPTQWHLAFFAGYSRVFRACYAADFDVVPDDGRWAFTGRKDLGALAGGLYEYSGYATPEEIVCRYRSSRDQGEFRLKRVNSKLQIPNSKGNLNGSA
jgi:hypothetical protein